MNMKKNSEEGMAVICSNDGMMMSQDYEGHYCELCGYEQGGDDDQKKY